MKYIIYYIWDDDKEKRKFYFVDKNGINGELDKSLSYKLSLYDAYSIKNKYFRYWNNNAIIMYRLECCIEIFE